MQNLFRNLSITALVSAASCCVPLVVLGQAGGPGPGGPRSEEARAAAVAKIKEAAAVPTPHTADDHPDLSGLWMVPESGAYNPLFTSGKTVTPDGRTIKPIVGPEDQEHKGNLANVARRAADTAARPTYKPEFTAKAKDNFERAAYLDPSYLCAPLGVPRLGAPTEIAQTPTAVYFFYTPNADNNEFRIVPTDGRPHDKDAEPMASGDAIGRWEGNTLVIDTNNFNEDTWLDDDGSFHSSDMHVIERFTRQGNTLVYSVVVEDPKVMAKPWSPERNPRTLIAGKPGMHAQQNYPCVEKDRSHLSGNERH